MKPPVTVWLLAGMLVASIVFVAFPAQAEELVTVEARAGAQQSFILIKPDKPKAAVVLIPGGWGNLGLGGSFGKPTVGHSGYADNHYLVNRREDYARRGILVALVDAPSDAPSKGMSYGHRLGGDHVTDLAAVVAYLKKQADVPVWLVGDSAGAFSLINAATNLGDTVRGLVFVSSVTRLSAGKPIPFATQFPDGVLDADGWERVGVPVLVVANKQDQCAISLPADADKLAAKLAGTKKVQVKYFDHGASGRDPCVCPSAHCFTGIQDEVNAAIAEFILAN